MGTHVSLPIAALALATSGVASAQIGTRYCSPAVPNASGLAGRLTVLGSADLALNGNQLMLVASDLPSDTFGIFVTSRTMDLVPHPGGSLGNLCLGLPLGRYVGPGQVLSTGAAGRFRLALDLARTPEGAGFAQVDDGDTWHFQAWFRDITPGGAASSNFSDAVEVPFTATPAPPGMEWIPPGTFMMGSEASQAPYFSQLFEAPVHQVTISRSFWMGRYELTQAEYEAVTGTNPSIYLGDSLPVQGVNWNDALAYCAALNAQHQASLPPGYHYRLPTEAEWEYACRAGTTTEFNLGPELLCDDARIRFSDHSGVHCDPGSPTVVGSYAPNAFGLHDMHGNVFELCLDSFTYAPYDGQPVTDPFVTGGTLKVMRSGAYGLASHDCRSASRNRIESDSPGGPGAGFRVVLAPILVP